ncbi:alpha/beta fold hydrolase [Dokdonella sp.]|uniref:alpha/beta fold hydrolase n=1 Tax=Dokdonella sp. TaxID=2291710 RepID=UPI003C5EE17A
MMAAVGNEFRIPLRHLELAAKAWGDPADPPMLAVHGWLDNAGTFDRLAPLLKGHYVVAIDLAGHGRSDHRPPGNWYPYVDFLDEIGEAMDQLGWQDADLLGHSLGATLVSVFAAICPQRVRRLLLIEGLGPIATAADQSLEQLRRSQRARAAFRPDKLRVFNGLEEAVAVRRKVSELSLDAARCIVERGVKVVGAGSGGDEERSGTDASVVGGAKDQDRNGDPDSEGVQALRHSTRNLARSDNVPFEGGVAKVQKPGGDSEFERVQALHFLSWSSDPALTLPSSTRLTEEQLASILPAITAPTLLLLAEPAAPYLKREVMDARIALLDDIEVVRMSGSHHLHLEIPDLVAAPIKDFLLNHPIEVSSAVQVAP